MIKNTSFSEEKNTQILKIKKGKDYESNYYSHLLTFYS
jgi:hypothetical protein